MEQMERNMSNFHFHPLIMNTKTYILGLAEVQSWAMEVIWEQEGHPLEEMRALDIQKVMEDMEAEEVRVI